MLDEVAEDEGLGGIETEQAIQINMQAVEWTVMLTEVGIRLTMPANLAGLPSSNQTDQHAGYRGHSLFQRKGQEADRDKRQKCTCCHDLAPKAGGRPGLLLGGLPPRCGGRPRRR